MSGRKVIAICLDAFDISLAERMMARGKLKGLAALKARSARFILEHGVGHEARTTGLTGEHVATGLKPETTKRWSPFLFDPETYDCVQRFTMETPFLVSLGKKFVVVDATYFDLQACENGVGIVGWSGHDPGVLPFSRPEGLSAEIDEKFGVVGDQSILNHNAYSSVEATRALEAHVVSSVQKRSRLAKWMLTERFDDWDVALVAFSEAHDAIEQFYHGVDPDGPVSHLPSAKAAADALDRVYEEISDGIAGLVEAVPDAAIMVFAMHGMGRNETDVASMILLPELMLRQQTGISFFQPAPEWRLSSAPLLKAEEDWSEAVISRLRLPFAERLKRLPMKAARKLKQKLSGGEQQALAADEFSLHWLPAYCYREFWPDMKAFALPSLFNGAIRVNLQGREKGGRVTLEEYSGVLDEVEAMLNACTDDKTGRPVVRKIRRLADGSPLSLGPSQADLLITWNGNLLGFSHPEYGRIGPAPMRRVGGHTGGHGALYLSGKGFVEGDFGEASSFDIPPTIVELLGGSRLNRLDGRSVLGRLAA